jgi:hypothetical protein
MYSCVHNDEGWEGMPASILRMGGEISKHIPIYEHKHTVPESNPMRCRGGIQITQHSIYSSYYILAVVDCIAEEVHLMCGGGRRSTSRRKAGKPVCPVSITRGSRTSQGIRNEGSENPTPNSDPGPLLDVEIHSQLTFIIIQPMATAATRFSTLPLDAAVLLKSCWRNMAKLLT